MLFRRTTRWPTWELRTPFEELDRMRRQMDLLSEGLSRGVWREPAAGVFPLMNVTEDKNNYYVRAELPGFKGDDLDISERVKTNASARDKPDSGSLNGPRGMRYPFPKGQV